MLKLGVINVLNVLPVYYQLLRRKGQPRFMPVFGKVTALNDKLRQGHIDLSVVSSFEYALNPDLYYVLPDLCVGSDGPVHSIYLFSQLPLEQLNDQHLLLTEYSLTSVHLIQALLKGKGLQYTYRPDLGHQAELLIADDAIRRFYQKRDPYVYDLGQLWKEKTGLPFVFALWVVRKEVYHREPNEVKGLHQGLIASRDAAVGLLDEMSQDRFSGIFPSQQNCQDYLANLHYELGPAFLAGFRLFQEKMVDIGKLPKVIELEFIPDVTGK